jgi:hypothetical protein
VNVILGWRQTKHIESDVDTSHLEYDQHANDLGAIVEKMSKTHQIKYVGAHGGMLFAKRY